MDSSWDTAITCASLCTIPHLGREFRRLGISPRVLLDLAGEDLSGFVQELLAPPVQLGPEELEALAELGRRAAHLAALERRARANESHFDDEAVVARSGAAKLPRTGPRRRRGSAPTGLPRASGRGEGASRGTQGRGLPASQRSTARSGTAGRSASWSPSKVLPPLLWTKGQTSKPKLSC